MNYSNKDQQVQAIRKNWREIESIEHPTIDLQLEAMKQNPKAIMCISNQTEELHLEIVKLFDFDTSCKFNILGDWLGEPVPENEDSYTNKEFIVDWPLFSNLENLSEKVQHAMLDKSIKAFESIRNPYKSVQIRAVKSFWPYITRIKKPSEDVKVTAVLSNIKALEYIKDLSDKSKLTIIRSGINFNKSEHIGYDRYGDRNYSSTNLFYRLGKLSNKCQVEAVKLHWLYIEKITDPCEEAQEEALRQSIDVIKILKNPCESVQIEVAKKIHEVIGKYNLGKASYSEKQKAIEWISKLNKKVHLQMVEEDWSLAELFKQDKEICSIASRKFDLDFNKPGNRDKSKPKLPTWYIKT